MIAATGVKAFLLGCLALMVLTYGLLGLAGDNVALWFPLRLLFGFAGAGMFVGSEIWINALAPDHLRGRVIGIYSTCLALGFAAGPFLIDWFGTVGFTPFFIGMLIFSTALGPILMAQGPTSAQEETSKSFFHLLPKAPVTFLSASVFAGAEAAILTFLPVYALAVDWGESVGARAVTVYGLGRYYVDNAAEKLGYGFKRDNC